MKDALVARQAKLPGVTTTCGTSLPEALLAQLTEHVSERVDVLYDVGQNEERVAQRNAHRIRAAGLKCSVVRLPVERTGTDVVDYLQDHGSPRDLKRLIIRARRRDRRR
jgi:hypothetical protein